jgi:DNA-binding transcriptional regulator YhcF (GntR family)/ADP-ribosylglycohydrolase
MKPVARKTLATLIAEQIRSEIVRGNMKASHRLPGEQELSAELHVGRPTLREALRILEGQGWVQIKFSGGVFVSDPERLADRMSAYYGKEGILDLLDLELVQLGQEGREITESLHAELGGLREGGKLRQIEEFDQKLQLLPQSPSFRHAEPVALSDIRSARPEAAAQPRRPVPADLGERIHGGLLGRCVGSLIGSPVNGWTAEAIEQYLRALDAYPLNGTMPYAPSEAALGEYAFIPHENESSAIRPKALLRGVEPAYAILSDTVLSLKVMQLHGWDFSSEDVGEEWLSSLPYRVLLTAERQAYGNLVRGLAPPATATSLNPFREWIGGTVRADFYGYVCPGDPAAAAMLAFRDARVSHTKNGVYGAMFVAAAIAAAFTAGSAEEIVAAGMGQIPKGSRLWELLAQVCAWRREGAEWRTTLRRIGERCAGYKRPHVLPNVARLVLGLLYGGLDVRKTLCLTVMCGSDPDCNAGAAGSIVGVHAGAAGIPEDLAGPVGDTLHTAVLGLHEMRIDDVVGEAVRIARECPLHEERETQ